MLITCCRSGGVDRCGELCSCKQILDFDWGYMLTNFLGLEGIHGLWPDSSAFTFTRIATLRNTTSHGACTTAFNSSQLVAVHPAPLPRTQTTRSHTVQTRPLGTQDRSS